MNVLELLLLSGEFIENKEGTVITFSNGKLAKQKNLQYLLIHGLLSSGLKEHCLIKKILNDTVDDLIAVLPIDAVEERSFVDDVSRVITHHVNALATEAFEFFNKEYRGDRKEFSMKHKKHHLFHFMVRLFNDNNIEVVEKVLIDHVIFSCRRLEMARTYLRNLGFERELKFIEDD
jgi:hypothetical protein